MNARAVPHLKLQSHVQPATASSPGWWVAKERGRNASAKNAGALDSTALPSPKPSRFQTMRPPAASRLRPATLLPTPWRARHTSSPPPATAPDPADWERSPEWYGSQGRGWGRGAGEPVFSAASPVGNGVVTVTAHPASLAPLGSVAPEWRVLRFGEDTRQSVALVDVPRGGGPASTPTSRPAALAFEYVKSVVACSLTALGSMPPPILEAPAGGGAGGRTPQPPSILCIGVGGGSVPLALASLFPGASVAGVDLCPAVLGAADAMGLTAAAGRAPNLTIRLGDGVAALEALPAGSLDLVVVDAFDGADDVPSALTTVGGVGLSAAAAALHPAHGALVINLHAGPKPGPGDWLTSLGRGGPAHPPTIVVRPDGTGPGASALATARAWSLALLDGGAGSAWLVGVRRQANAVVVVARGGKGGGANSAASAATAAAARAAMALPFDVGDRAAYGYYRIGDG